MERHHRTCRTRLKRFVRNTIGFAISRLRHEIVIGLLVHREAFGLLVGTRQQHIETLSDF